MMDEGWKQVPWATGLCGCCSEPGQPFDVFWCLPCALGRQYDALDVKDESMNVIFCCLGTCCPHCVSLLVRHTAVQRFHLDEGCVCAWCIGFCCAPCSVCQVQRELYARGRHPGGCCCQPARGPPPAQPDMGYSPMGRDANRGTVDAVPLGA